MEERSPSLHLLFCLRAACDLGAAPLDESLLPVLQVVMIFGISVVSGGVWLAASLTRSRRASKSSGAPCEDLQAACRQHDWLRMDDGGFVCLRCSYRAGASLPPSRGRFD
jgi:hypothetical protein